MPFTIPTCVTFLFFLKKLLAKICNFAVSPLWCHKLHWPTSAVTLWTAGLHLMYQRDLKWFCGSLLVSMGKKRKVKKATIATQARHSELSRLTHKRNYADDVKLFLLTHLKHQLLEQTSTYKNRHLWVAQPWTRWGLKTAGWLSVLCVYVCECDIS